MGRRSWSETRCCYKCTKTKCWTHDLTSWAFRFFWCCYHWEWMWSSQATPRALLKGSGSTKGIQGSHFHIWGLPFFSGHQPFFSNLSLSKLSLIVNLFLHCQDSVSGIKAGVAAGMPVIGITTRNPEHILTEAKPTLLIKDYADPKLWEALEELDKKGGNSTNEAWNIFHLGDIMWWTWVK